MNIRARDILKMPVPMRMLACSIMLIFATPPDSTAIAAGPPQGNARSDARAQATLPVTSCADDGSAGTLRNVVAAAASGDIIDLTQLACSDITLLTGQIEIHLDDLTMNGPGQTALTIDGNHNGRVFLHDGRGTLTVSGLTIAHGLVDFRNFNPDWQMASRGGCILSYLGESENSRSGSVMLVDSTVTSCEVNVTHGAEGVYALTGEGGGVNANGDITLVRSTISDNKVICVNALSNGGGVSSRYGMVRITDSLITRNSSIAYDGVVGGPIIPQAHAGGVRAYNGAIISGSTVSANFAGCNPDTQTCSGAFGGGVMANSGDSTVQIVASKIYGNVAQAAKSVDAPVHGGGLYLTGQVTVENCTISDNRAQGPVLRRSGGGVTVSGTASIVGSTVDRNTADLGGGIFVLSGELSLVNSTVSSNTVSGAGGGIYAIFSPLYGPEPLIVVNSTITSNVSNGTRGGGGIVDNHQPTLGLSDFESSIVAGNINTLSGASYDADLGSSQPASSVTGANNLIIAASGVSLPSDTIATDPQLGPLQDNGGPTSTHALSLDSPAIDTGNNLPSLPFDQRGTGYLRNSGKATDIGAFEYQAAMIDFIFADGFD